MNKKGLVYLYLSALSFVVTLLFYFGDFSIVRNISDRIDDFFIQKKIAHKPYKSQNVTMVSIDEKSLRLLGQWPWSRDKIATIINNLNNARVGIIGLDITFAEEDGKSPSVVLKGKKGFSNLEDYDQVLAKAFSQAPVVAGIIMHFEDNNPYHSYFNYPFTPVTPFNNVNTSTLINAQGIISNIPPLQKSAYSTGFLNTFPDERWGDTVCSARYCQR